jgi:thiamine-phosphate pyrophosphorylase
MQARLAWAHSAHELAQARRSQVDAVIISPVFPTQTHPGEPALGRIKFLVMARSANKPVIALGGMTLKRARGLPGYGWAAIDGLTYPHLINHIKRRPHR